MCYNYVNNKGVVNIMLLYIIRHGDPIYSPDTLTEKGKLQAKALAKRLAVHSLDKIYSSPLGRAKETAQPTCDLLGLNYIIEEWTSEGLAWKDFSKVMPDGKRRWSFHIQTTLIKNNETINVTTNWYELNCFKDTNSKAGYERIQRCSDEFLGRHGYEREGAVYRITRPNDDRIAVFCHQGFGVTWISHLLGIPPHIFWTSFDITHSGVSIFHFENYEDGYTTPKCLVLSDISHIYKDDLPLQYNNKINL
jgi:broad specificity phosphatase PhoE